MSHGRPNIWKSALKWLKSTENGVYQIYRTFGEKGSLLYIEQVRSDSRDFCRRTGRAHRPSQDRLTHESLLSLLHRLKTKSELKIDLVEYWDKNYSEHAVAEMWFREIESLVS
jgi:hypothetical protein